MADAKTVPLDLDVQTWLRAVEPSPRREDALALDSLFREVTGFAPVLWRGGIVGYGTYAYRYESGREGRFLATGFAPRTSNLVVYIIPGYSEFGAILDRLGPHRRGKACLYLGRLGKVDEGALRDLIRAGLDDLATRWPVSPT